MVIAFGVIGAGCSGPCESLAEMICECKPNRTEENACLEQLRAVQDRVVSTQEDEVCSNLLDTCTCDALDRGEFSACGLSE